MINNYKDFNLTVGKVIEQCQMIEHDIKWLYAMMLNGNPDENIKEIITWTLGKTVFELEALDNTDKKPLISKEEYGLLKHITGERNYISHQIYRDFLYENDYLNHINYLNAKKRLEIFYIKIESLSHKVEKFRMKYAMEKVKILNL